MRKRLIVWSGVAAVLAFAPIAEARGGHGPRVESQQCVDSCDHDDNGDDPATTVVAATDPGPASTADAPGIQASGGTEVVPNGSDPSTATTPASTDPAPGSDPSVPADPAVSTGTTVTPPSPASSTTAAPVPTGSSSTTAAVVPSSSSPSTAAPVDPTSSSSTPPDPTASSTVPPPVDSTTAPPLPTDPTTLPPPPPDTTPPPPPPPPGTFTMSTATPRVGEPVVFDGSAFTCAPVNACSYTWTWFFRSADGTTTFTGGQMGLGPVVTYSFDAFAASKALVIVVLRVSEGRIGPRTVVSASFPVLAA